MKPSALCFQRRNELLLIAAAAVFVISGLEKSAGEEARNDSRNKGVLVLKSGRIAEGRISQNAGGYVVDLSNGSMMIPFNRVMLRATNRIDAYRKLRDTMPEASVNNHINLARWCMSHELLDQARIELNTALQIEPENKTARTTLRRVEDLRNPESPIHRQKQKQDIKTADGFTPVEIKSLAGLSRQAGQDFILRIQPILLNKCGNASCHGQKVSNDFRLHPIRRGAGKSRVYSERNLATVLKYIDMQSPARSPLLVEPQGDHERRGRSVFSGHRGAEQLAALRKWVRLVSGEQSTFQEKENEKPSLAAFTQSKRKRNPTSIQEDRLDLKKPPKILSVDSSSLRKLETEDDLLKKFLREEQADTFSPDAFNRIARKRNAD